LLSEQDLNRLDQYIRNKNRLHLRNLHGWGVVNGLLVVCDPCGDVTVTQGYAVDPCGNDIVVCEQTRANLCELIRKCRQSEPSSECQPFRAPPTSNCVDAEEEWVLTISYREWQSRGVTPLRGSSCGCSTGACDCGASAPAASSCICGGTAKSGGGCGCGGAKTAMARAVQSAAPAASRGVPAQCEATVTCEGYAFSVYRKPEPQGKDEARLGLEGAFWDALRCCAQPLLDALPPMPTLDNTDSTVVQSNQLVAYSRWCCRFRDNLLKYFLQSRNASCEVLTRLRAISCPNPQNRDNFSRDLLESFYGLLAVWLEGLKNCLCLALLPPVPQSTCDLRVPLATVRIRARDCQVLSICNWTLERKLLISWPAVTHWLSVVPIGSLLRELLDRLCCNSLLDIFDRLFDEDEPVPGTNNPTTGENTVIFRAAAATYNDANGTGAESAARDKGLAASLNQASGLFAARFSADFTQSAANLEQLMRGFQVREGNALQLGAVLNATSPRFKLPENGQSLNPVERRNLPLVLLAETVVRPLMNTMLGEKRSSERMAELHEELSGDRKQAVAAAPVAETDLRQEVATLRQELHAQREQINVLMSKQTQ
jgi:hypothetical protein